MTSVTGSDGRRWYAMPIDSGPDDPGPVGDTPAAPDQRPGPDVPPGRDAQSEPDASDGRPPRDEPEAATFRERQLAAHADYREKVAATDQAHAARQAWAEAVPRLRAAWEEHKQRYPERSHALPRTQPDGSWVADANRSLTPEQNAEATKAH